MFLEVMLAFDTTPFGLGPVLRMLQLLKSGSSFRHRRIGLAYMSGFSRPLAQPEIVTVYDRSMKSTITYLHLNLVIWGTGKSVFSVHLSSVFRLRFGLAGGASCLLGILTGSGVGSLVTANP